MTSSNRLQEPLLAELLRDGRPVHVWLTNASKLVPQVYERDSSLARDLEKLLRHLSSAAANLDCIGTDDPAAPPVGASAADVLIYLLSGMW